MGPDVLKHLFGLLIPILALCIPIIALLGGIVLKLRREQWLHATLREYAERGQPVPAEVLAVLRPPEDVRMTRENAGLRNLRFGLMNVAVGLGLMVAFYFIVPDQGLWAAGCVPLLIGLALLLLWRLETAGQPQGRDSDPAAPR